MEEILLQIQGQDKSGLFAQLCGMLQEHKVDLLDIQQITTLGRLSLVLLVQVPSQEAFALVRKLKTFCVSHRLSLDFELVSERPSYQELYVLTLLGKKLTLEALFHLSKRLAQEQVNIERMHFLSKKNLECLEILLRPLKSKENAQEKLKEIIFAEAFAQEFDCALQREDLFRRSKRLIVMDMDSTLIEQEVIDEMALYAGVHPEVVKITEKAMRGEIPFEEALQQRVSLLKDLQERDLHEVLKKIRLTEGAERLLAILKKMGFKTAIVSGGFNFFVNYFKEKLGFDYAFANELEIENGKLTGRLKGEIITRKKKAEILRYLAAKEKISLEQTIAVGDGANDLDMLQAAGLGVAFRAKPIVRQSSSAFIEQAGLDVILYLLGISEEEAQRLDDC
ncbi:MAG: phosphoserine phosphatase SerB [Leptospiraceae bacterium]|nr:phosphoserine phosphatase SerB [Leptospiraceae bacterium]MDW8306595.1 phosphoserine phosphatase SerB [Leptospiraceae bacterium]